ncbi:MAG: hypothetical protein BWY78_01332 [Alphaproteobacteria bacterium ADurb.Bin438]|nr:MAG: hypothetical protein BWY78_01332 [Alphaproteobacteria bacterium ADurb.Bin438]
MDIILSLVLVKVLVPINAGTVQPKPTNIGTKAVPESPNIFINLSIKKAILDIYPVSSKIDNAKNKNAIGGIKLIIVTIPLPSPLVRINFKSSGAFKKSSKAPNFSMKTNSETPTKGSIKAPPKSTENENIIYIENKKKKTPKTLCKTIPSILSVKFFEAV